MANSKTLRIVHCVRAPIGGIFRHIVDLATTQTAMGHDVGIICDSNTGGAFEAGAIAAVAPRLALGVHRLPMQRHLSVADARSTVAMLDVIRRMSPDVMHGHGAKGGAFARGIGTFLGFYGKRPLRLYCAHGGSLHYDPSTREGAVYFRIERLLERFTDGFIYVSDYEKTAYHRKIGVPKKPHRLIYNGLRPDEFEPVRPAEDAADVVFAGMMRDLKGPQILIEALRLMADRGLRPTVRFLGDGDDRPAYEARVQALGLAGQVTFHDFKPTRQALAQGRLLVVPSLAESMPYIVLEASAARVPMLATRVGGIPEIFLDRSDRLLPAGDAHALAAALAETLNRMPEAVAEADSFGREVAGRFSLQRMTDEVVAFYEDLREPRRHRPAEIVPLGRLSPDANR